MRFPTISRNFQAMPVTIIVSFVVIFITNLATCTILLTPSYAKGLANKLRIFYEIDVMDQFVKPNEHLTEMYHLHFTSVLPVEQAQQVKTQISYLNDAISVAKGHSKLLKKFDQDYHYAQTVKRRFESIISNLYDVEETAKSLDDNLYVEPSLFDLMAHHKDPTTNCVTHNSSIVLIDMLYKNILDFEIRCLASGLYARDMQTILGTTIDLKDEDVMQSQFQKRIDKLYRVASDAIKTANEEIEKCTEKK